MDPASSKISGFWKNISFDWREITIETGKILLLFSGLYLVGLFIPEGFDYVHYFSKGIYPSFWIPWSIPIINLTNNAGLFALIILSLVLRTRRYKGSALILGMVLVSLPTLWEVVMGNVEGFVLLGLMALPWGAPLALFKPQIAAFALLARKSSIIAGILTLIISLLIYGLWPVTLLHVGTPAWRSDWPRDITLYPGGLLLAIPLLWFSRGDEDLLMAAGSLGTPHLFPYHFLC